MRPIRMRILSLACAGVVLGLACAGSAYADSPWWHLSVTSRPTYLQPGQARNEVQRLIVKASEGVYRLDLRGAVLFASVGEKPEELQEQLEKEFYGAQNVHVTGSPGLGQNPYEVYVIEFVHSLADQPVAVPEVSAAFNKTNGSESVEEVTTGRSDGQIVVTAVNLGDASADPSIQPIVLAAKLPAALKAVAIEGFVDEYLLANYSFPLECALSSSSCTFTGQHNGGAIRIPPYQQIQMRISVDVKNSTQREGVDHASVTGGGARGAAVDGAITVSEAPVPFGVNTYEMRPEEPGGATDTQAGSHPFQLTTTVGFNETYEGRAVNSGHPFGGSVPAMAKDLHFDLPPGLIGNPTPFAQCSLGDFLNGEESNKCPAQTVVGVARVILVLPHLDGEVPFTVPLFNLVPSVGEPARFGFLVHGVPVLLTTALRTGGDYGVTVSVSNISQLPEFLGSEVTFWGVPGAPQHDNVRNWGCLERELNLAVFGQAFSAQCPSFEVSKPPPLLSLPPSCTGVTQSSVDGDPWSEPLNDALLAVASMPALDGCNQLQFSPSIEAAPDGHAASTPTGLAVRVRVPQEVSLNAEGLAEADVKNTTVTLPAGVVLNPAGADGLQACSEAEIGLHSAGPSSCPDASKIGLVKIKTPLLPHELEGAAYLAEQDKNPFGSLIAMYILAEDPISGSRVKLAGEVVPDPVTGQLVSTFKDTPELPFETFELHFFGGDRAPLATPAYCGQYSTTASIEPSSGGGPVDSNSTFEVLTGPNGASCSSPLPFDPSLTTGTTSIQAGGFSPFTMTMSREDGQQALQAISLHMPPGISGLLSGVKLCGEAQANAGTCGPESLIGETIVSVGVGGDPFSVKGGKVYITEGYEGAPYGLSIVNPAKAGPFDLGQVIVRAKIEVDPITAQLTVTTDTTGPYKIPTILDGIPLQIRHVNVLINRPGFTFNPTNCNPMSVTATLTSAEGATSKLSVPLQVTNCAILAFKPTFQVSTSGKTSRRIGASLHVKLSYPKAPFGSQANIKSVKVNLPRQLPSNLKTLQNACPHQVFEANPASCPVGSRVGSAKALTPLIPVPLEGPAYFVSYGGAKFPELVIVLQGYGVTLDLHGETFINERTGITSSTFHTVPDAPVGSFELTLPQGSFSALDANTNLCTVRGGLKMPTLFLAQNGAAIKQNTPIDITGCPKAKHKPTKKSKRPPAPIVTVATRKL